MAKKKLANRKKRSAAKVLVLRTCSKDLTGHGGFQWPASGPVKCSDWSPAAECGHGLHALLWGEGNGELVSWDPHSKWLVVEVDAADIVAIGSDKVKFPRGEVVHCGDQKSATEYLAAHGAAGRAIVGGTAAAGYGGTAAAGYRGTATAGYRGTATAGDRGTATAGYSGTAAAGYSGTATAGDRGTATAGYSGTATAGYRGPATAGCRGTILLKWWDESTGRYRIAVGNVGENGIGPHKKYRVEGKGNLVKVQS